MPRALRFPVFVLALTLAAFAVILFLEKRADAGGRAQLQVSSLKAALIDLDGTPFGANPAAGRASAMRARLQARADERVLSRGLGRASGVRASKASLKAADANLASIESTVANLFAVTARPVSMSGIRQTRTLQANLAAHNQRLLALLTQIGHSDFDRAQLARLEAEIGTGLALLMLLSVFLTFYVRAVQVQRANDRLLSEARVDAITDPLTGLGNRRALLELTAEGAGSAPPGAELLLALFDLNGFKRYNDTFGHGAGDALLARFGACLGAVTSPGGSAYRLGGDEFCVLVRCTREAADALIAAAASALSAEGEGWKIDCACGRVWIPSEVSTVTQALLVADRRMYADKAVGSQGRPFSEAHIPQNPDQSPGLVP